MSPGLAAAAILIAAICTYAMRALPSLLFGGQRKMPPFLSYLGQVLTPAIMGVLLIYCLKGSFQAGWRGLLPELAGVAVVAVLHLWRRNALLSIGLGTAAYMLLLRFVF